MNSREKSAQPIELIHPAEIASIAGDDCPGTTNPYSPAREVKNEDAPTQTASTTAPCVVFPSLPRTIVRWTVVCCIAAAPSFILGFDVTEGRAGGMIAAILTFICLYIAADLISRHWPIRSVIAVRRTLIFVYVSRIVVSCIFPAAIYLDMVTGLVMSSLIGAPMGQFRNVENTGVSELALFWLTYRMTFVQAILMNILLFVWGLLSLPFMALSTRHRSLKDESVALDNI